MHGKNWVQREDSETAARALPGQEVTAVHSREGGADSQFDELVVRDCSEEALRAALLARKRVVHVGRKGKQLWIILESAGEDGSGAKEKTRNAVLFHFGMTGMFVVKDVHAYQYKDVRVDASVWPPRFSKVVITFGHDTHLALVDPRRLARIRIGSANPELEEPIAGLAPDPTTLDFQRAPFVAVLKNTNAPLKAVLLDQNRAVSGVGNWIADEVCFRAAIHPSTPCSSMNEDCCNAVFDAIASVCLEACRCIQESGKLNYYPDHWLFHYRWGAGPNGSSRMSDGTIIQMSTVGGRTTAVVPSAQRKASHWRRPASLLEAEVMLTSYSNGTLLLPAGNLIVYENRGQKERPVAEKRVSKVTSRTIAIAQKAEKVVGKQRSHSVAGRSTVHVRRSARILKLE
ncbi:Formamidopyrimidine-DNA glycosylase [Porphyridium purpureum]|uniref:Formamidopyrimidine-DNA glycosylase n=1 Tax=Porphyridium purpureum TaxID=35688 RepID=A0A5J4YW80_PORPP|nr:Formamidopyrimidine-DNA glycosylase [Porphyridium purpureum]|eukprot:POR8810..scf209_3